MSDANTYVYKSKFPSGIKPDQTVNLRKCLFKFVPDIKFDEQSSIPAEEWYPLANSYYAFTEDVDAFARVHHLLETKQSADSLSEEEDTDLKLTNEYSERKAYRQYLRTNPFCFLILGKPGLGEEDLGRRLANYWKCVYVDPLILIEEEIACGSRAGECIEFNLRCGRAIGIDIMTRLLARRVQKPDVLHRGFVLSGFPLIPNDLYEEDPISSESAVFNVRDIFEEIFDEVVHTIDISNKMEVSMIDSSRDETTKESEVSESIHETAETEMKMSMEWSIENQIVGPADISTDLEKQLNCIFGLFHEPFLIIYLYARNPDVLTKRDNYYYDVYSNKNLDMQKVNLFYEMGAVNEELTEDLFDEGKNPFAENPNLRHIVKLPENLRGIVSTQLDRYHNEIANFLDYRILSHPVQYYLKLDGRAFISQMLKLIKLRLKVLPLQYVMIPTRLGLDIDERLGEGGGEETERELLTVEEAFPRLSKQNIAGPMYKWMWSDWGPLCPISMAKNRYQTGSPNYAVHLFNKIYFLADENCYNKFYQNPRNCLQSPYPKPGPKIFLFGPPVSGKSAVARCLGYLLNSKVITPDELHVDFFNQAIEEYKEKLKQAAIAEALEILKQKSMSDLAETYKERNQRIEAWEAMALKLLANLDEIFHWLEKKSVPVLSSFPQKMDQDETEIRSMDEEGLIRQRLADLNIPPIQSREECRRLMTDRAALKNYLPMELKSDIIPETPSVFDPFVLHYANSKVQEVVVDEIKQQVNENAVEMYTRGMRAIEEQMEFEGWIIDGMTTDLVMLKQIYEDFPPHEVVILTCSDINFLIERFKLHKKHLMEFRDFRNFFLLIGEKDAAWRSPSVATTETYKRDIVTDLISDMLNFDEELTEAERAAACEQYELNLAQYENELENVNSFLLTTGIVPLKIDVKDLNIEELMKEVINSLQDKYRRRASEFTDEDRAEEVQQIMAQTVQAVEGEGGGNMSDDFYARNRQYGDTFYYCPVTFATKFVLWRGKEKYAAKFKDKIYFLANEAHLEEFIRFPRKYLIQNAPPQRFPPPRICIIGENEEERNEVAKQLAMNLGVRYFNFVQLRRAAIENLSNISLLVKVENDFPDVLRYDFYDTLFRRIFFEEPYKYIGFVLDGFPNTPADFNCMLVHEAIPDVIICLTSSREDYINKELQKSMDQWRRHNEQTRKEEEIINTIIRNEWEEKRKSRYSELMEKKRASRYSNRISQGDAEPQLQVDQEDEAYDAGFASDTQISFDSVIEQQDHDETMKILDEEFPEPMLDETFEENEEEVIGNVTAELEAKYDAFVESYEEIKKICDDEQIPCMEISGNLEKAIIHAYIIGNDLKFRGPSHFERCYDVSVDVAEKLLSSGYYLFSIFGRLCPVQYFDEHNPLHMYLANEAKNNIYPVIHRHYIYLIGGKKEHEQFMKNPLKYTSVVNFHFPLIPMRVAVIGPPKSGKTTLANRFKRDLGFHLVSRGEAVRYTLSNGLYTNLYEVLEGVLRQGEELSDEMVMNCIQVASFCGESVTRGLIFDGFPNSISEVNLLCRLGLVPHLIIDLQADDETVLKQATTLSDKNPQYSTRFIKHLLEQWKKTKDDFREWCDLEYQNIYKLPVDRSIWGVWDQAKELTLSVAFERKHYYKHAKWDWPLRLAYMLVTPLEFLERQSGYKSYCPACLYYSRALTNGGEPPDRTGLVQYRNKFYWLCEEHIEEFMKVPDKFLVPSNVCLPQDLPKVVHLHEEPKSPVEDGYCVVCYKKNFPKKVLNKGDAKYAVVYRDKTYLFDSVECLRSFMITPERFCYMTINFKQDEFAAMSLEYRDLPVLGMLEQFVARTVVRAVNHVNRYRPVIPGLTISQAAMICIGLNLKIYNQGTPKKYLPLYEQGLQSFHLRRLNLMKYLDLMKKYLNPYVHYEEPNTPSSCEEEIEEDETPLLRIQSSMI